MDARDRPCPVCGHVTLDVNLRMELGAPVAPAYTNEKGTVQSHEVEFVPFLYCRRLGCGFERRGYLDEDARAVFIVPEDA